MTDYKNEFIEKLRHAISDRYEPDVCEHLTSLITISLKDYEVTPKCTEIVVSDNSTERYLRRYIATKKIEGRSPKTLRRYESLLRHMFNYLQTPVEEIDIYALRLYLAVKSEDGISDRSLEGLRSVICAYFNWLHKEGLVTTNPAASLSAIKYKKVVRKPFSKVELEKIKASCETLRDRAIVETLLATGCRVSELVGMDIKDVDFQKQEIKVLGKGNKERVVFINDVCCLHLSRYLNSRSDDRPELFTSKRKQRIRPGSVRFMLKTIEKVSGVKDIHPHKFRRTTATALIDAGMALPETSAILGHNNINTTMTYVYTNMNSVKASYQRVYN